MTGKIFISYRREDEPGYALALFGRLEEVFPPERLFMDVEGGIAAGHDFVQVIEDQVRACDAMLVLIGPKWLTVTDDVGRRRLDNPQDFVRIEVEAALRLNKRVIPLLVNKTEMPRADALPEPLKPLARRNAVGLAQERFKSDAQGLIKALKGALAEAEAVRQQATTEAAAAEKQRVADRVTEAERAEKEKARLQAIAGLSPEHIAKAEELANWDFIKASEKTRDFRDHLARFPNGVTKRMAQTRLEALVWAGLPQPVDVPAVKDFLKEFPNGANAEEARSKLAGLGGQAAAAREKRERERQETEAWASASATGSIAAVEAFRKEWPNGRHANAARARIKEISDQPIRTFGPASAKSVAFAPDGRTALSGGHTALELWDIASGQQIRTFNHSQVSSVAFAPDGRTALSGSSDKTLELWDVASGHAIRTFTGHSGFVSSVAFAPDGRTALSGSIFRSPLKLWYVVS
jgi:hypothetical protein